MENQWKVQFISFCATSIAFRLLSTKYWKPKIAKMEVNIGCFGKSKRFPYNPTFTFHLNKAGSSEAFQAAAVPAFDLTI